LFDALGRFCSGFQSINPSGQPLSADDSCKLATGDWKLI